MKNGKKDSKKTTTKPDYQGAEGQHHATQCMYNCVPKERREEKGQKIFEETMAEISKFDENYKPTHQRCLVNPK